MVSEATFDLSRHSYGQFVWSGAFRWGSLRSSPNMAPKTPLARDSGGLFGLLCRKYVYLLFYR